MFFHFGAHALLFWTNRFFEMNLSLQESSGGHLSMSDNIRKAFHVHSLIVDLYLQEKIYVRMVQIADPNNPFGDIDETHCRALAE